MFYRPTISLPASFGNRSEYLIDASVIRPTAIKAGRKSCTTSIWCAWTKLDICRINAPMVTPVPAASSRATLSRLVAAAIWPERTSASASAFRLVNCKERKQPPASRTANMAAWDVYAVKPAIAAIESETSAAFAVNIARNRKPPSTLVRKVCTHSIEPPIKTPIAARKMLRAPNLSAIQPDIGMKHKSAGHVSIGARLRFGHYNATHIARNNAHRHAARDQFEIKRRRHQGERIATVFPAFNPRLNRWNPLMRFLLDAEA